MTDPTPDPTVNLGSAYPVDSQVPDVRDLGPWFWEKRIIVIDTRGRT